jgi:hypothetical protein
MAVGPQTWVSRKGSERWSVTWRGFRALQLQSKRQRQIGIRTDLSTHRTRRAVHKSAVFKKAPCVLFEYAWRFFIFVDILPRELSLAHPNSVCLGSGSFCVALERFAQHRRFFLPSEGALSERAKVIRRPDDV